MRKNSNKKLTSKPKEEEVQEMMDIVRKTKENFFNMVKDIKSKKVNERDIDQELDQELETIA